MHHSERCALARGRHSIVAIVLEQEKLASGLQCALEILKIFPEGWMPRDVPGESDTTPDSLK